MSWDSIFGLLHIWKNRSQFLSGFYITSTRFAGLHPSLCELLHERVLMLWYISLLNIEYVEWKGAFLSKITPRNLYLSITGISDRSRVNVGLLCIFLKWQKCGHWVFVLGIFKPFIISHLFILLMPCCFWRSAVRIYLDVEVMQKSSTNKYLSTSGFRQLVIPLILCWRGLLIVYSSKALPVIYFGCLIELKQHGLGISCPKQKLL